MPPIVAAAVSATCLVLVLAACGGSGGDSTSSDAPKAHYAESAKCRDQSAKAMAAIAKVDALTADDGSADMDAVGDVNYDVEAPNVVMYCSPTVWKAYDEATLHFGHAVNIDGNACYENFMPRYCDTDRQNNEMLAGVTAASKARKAVDAKTTKSTLPAPDEHTIAIRGTLRLYEGIAVESNGDQDYFCLGKDGYDDLYGGSPVTITDGTGSKVALGELDYGDPVADLWLTGKARKNGKGLCIFRWTVEGVPDTAEVYHSEMSGRDGSDFTLRQYRTDPSQLWYTLGNN